MLDIQYIIVGLILIGAVIFAGRSIYRRTRSFSVKSGCGSDCGCETPSKRV